MWAATTCPSSRTRSRPSRRLTPWFSNPPTAIVSHKETDPEAEFRRVIRRTFDRGGTVIIPAFALGRTQEVLYHLSQLVDEGELDPRDVFLDSPMAIKATDLYRQAEAEHDDDLKELVSNTSIPWIRIGSSAVAAPSNPRPSTTGESRRSSSRPVAWPQADASSTTSNTASVTSERRWSSSATRRREPADVPW